MKTGPERNQAVCLMSQDKKVITINKANIGQQSDRVILKCDLCGDEVQKVHIHPEYISKAGIFCSTCFSVVESSVKVVKGVLGDE